MKQLAVSGAVPKSSLKSLQRAVLLQALFDPSSLTHGPTWLRLLSSSVLPKQINGEEKLKQLFAVSESFQF